MRTSDWAKNFSLGVLANEVEFAIGIYKQETEKISESTAKALLVGKDFLERILNFENGGRLKAKIGAQEKLELLQDSKAMFDAWIKSEIPFPKNDAEYTQALRVFIGTLRDMAEKKKIEIEGVNNVEKLFSTMGATKLREIHCSSCRGKDN